MVRILTSLLGLCLLLAAQAQGPQIGFCRTYQTAQSFNDLFISKMQEKEEGYTFLLTSGPSFGCQKLKFFPNGTYFYDFVDLTTSRRNVSGMYQMSAFSFWSPASITLHSLPIGELMSVMGRTTFNVLWAKEDLLILVSCVNIGLLYTEQLHILVREGANAAISTEEMKAAVKELNVPLFDYLVEVKQTCPFHSVRGAPGFYPLNILLFKLGLPYPNRGGSQGLYSALGDPLLYIPGNYPLPLISVPPPAFRVLDYRPQSLPPLQFFAYFRPESATLLQTSEPPDFVSNLADQASTSSNHVSFRAL